MFNIIYVLICLCINYSVNFNNGVLGNDNYGLYSLLSSDQHELTPRLEDFFWTGSGDGAPPPERPAPTPTQHTLVRTTTVLATVYLDSYPPQAVTDKTTGDCVENCGDSVPGSLEPEIPDDRRYWLLTVIQGSTPDSLQLRLARLYQKAFLRQQERHLGIIKSLDAPTTRKKHEVYSFKVNRDFKMESSETELSLKYHSVHSSIKPTQTISIAHTVLNSSKSDNSEMFPADMYLDVNKSSIIDIQPTKLSELKWVLVAPTIRKREITSDKERNEENGTKEELIDIPLESDISNGTLLFKREIIKPEQQPPVHVHIQNITESSESGAVQIVYVVAVGGRAVPAAVAARDMRLVADAEVAEELGAVVTTKAEPAYLKAAEGLAGEATSTMGIQGAELWALAVGAAVAIILVLVLIALLCRLIKRRKTLSAASVRAYRHELMLEHERNQLKQVHQEKDGKLISVISPSRPRPRGTLLPLYRAASASSSSTTSSGVSEVAAALRRRQKKPHTLRIAQKKRVGTTDSLLEAAGVDSSDSAKEFSAPNTPTSYLSMPSVKSFPRGNTVEPLSKVLEPISVRHLDISPIQTPEGGRKSNLVPRRQMSSQLVRLGSVERDPGVIGPLVWDLHCQRIKDVPKQTSPPESIESGVTRMRTRFNELVDDARSLFGGPGSDPVTTRTDIKKEKEGLAQARNDNVRLPGSPYTALDTVRGKSASIRSQTKPRESKMRPRTSLPPAPRPPSLRAWDHGPPSQSLLTTPRVPPIPQVNPAFILAEGTLPPDDSAIPIISAIKSEIQRVRENAQRK